MSRVAQRFRVHEICRQAYVSGIPYARIADIDFVKPKSTVKPVKRGAHCNNDCDILIEPADIEVNSDFTKLSSSS